VVTAGSSLNSVAQGDSQSERIGNRIIVKNISVKGYLTAKGSTTVTAGENSNIARVIFFVDHQCNGALNTAGELLAVTTAINSFRDIENSDRFTVLRDFRIPVTTHGVAGDGTTNVSYNKEYSFEFYKDMKMLTQFDATAAAIASITNNSINCFAYIEDAACAVDIDFKSRIRYTG